MKATKVKVMAKYPGDFLVIRPGQAPEIIAQDGALKGYECYAFVNPELNRQMVISLEETVEVIENGALRKLNSLKNVCFRHKAYRLGAEVFSKCENLETVTLAEGTQTIPLGLFSDCAGLRAVHLPSTVTEIHMDAFKNCSALEGIQLPEKLAAIEPTAFFGCRKLKKLRLPDSVTELGADVFANCTGLTQVQLPRALEEIGDCAFMNCVKLEQIQIPAGVRVLPIGVFAGCKNLKKVILPDTVERIHPFAFYGCAQLEEVVVPNPEAFAPALRHTPYWRKHHPGEPETAQLPMELLRFFGGEVSGIVLSVMGYPWFDLDRQYQIFPTDHPDVFEVRSQCGEENGLKFYDCWLMDAALEPIDGILPMREISEIGFRAVEQAWEMRKKQAYRKLERR